MKTAIDLKACVICILVGMTLASGCAFLQQTETQIGNGVKQYCTQPLAQRLVIRENVNRIAAPNQIKVTCLGDEPQSGS